VIFLAQLALRNLRRNLGRSVIIGLIVVAGVFLQILGWGLVDGLDENILRAARNGVTSDILLRPEGYPTDGLSYPLDQTRPPPDLSTALPDASVSARTLFVGRLVKGAEASRVTGIAYERAADAACFPRENWKLEGAWPEPGADAIVLGDRLAALLEVKVGDSVVLQTRTVDGAQNAYTYTVTGLVHTDNNALDNLGAWLEMEAADRLLTVGARRSHVAVNLPPFADSAAAKARLGGLGWTARTVEEEMADFIAINKIRRAALVILVGIIMIIAALGIAITVMMAAYERVREIGTLLSMGMKRREVSLMFLFEGLVLGIAAGAAGAALGVLAVRHWQETGIYLGDAVMKTGKDLPMSAYVYTRFAWGPVATALGFSTVISTLASFFPARMASTLNPADAVRAT